MQQFYAETCNECAMLVRLENVPRTLINIRSEYIPTNGTAMVWDTYLTNLQLCKKL